MGLPLRSPVAKLSCEAATEENAKRRSFMPRTQVTGKANFSPGITCGVEVWRGSLGGTYLLPTLSVAGASLFPPCFRFHTPLIEPDVQIYRIRLSEKTHAIAKAIACDAVCNF